MGGGIGMVDQEGHLLFIRKISSDPLGGSGGSLRFICLSAIPSLSAIPGNI